MQKAKEPHLCCCLMQFYRNLCNDIIELAGSYKKCIICQFLGNHFLGQIMQFLGNGDSGFTSAFVESKTTPV